MRRRDFLRVSTGATAGATLGASAVTPAAAQEGGNTTTTEGSGGGTEHTVDMTDALVYEPAELTIAPGDTVVWDNVGQQGHTVTAYEDDIPEGATYFASGDYDSEQAARDAYPPGGDIPGGESYSYTFETTGTYEYFCIPHEQAGMVGSITVQEGGGQTGGGAPVEEDPEHMGVPFQAHFVGIATIGGIVVSLLFTFFFLKYGTSPHAGYPEED